MKFELMLATRHLISRRGRSVSLVSMLAVGGVALGVAALIGGASITSGFERAFQEKLLGVTSHLLVIIRRLLTPILIRLSSPSSARIETYTSAPRRSTSQITQIVQIQGDMSASFGRIPT